MRTFAVLIWLALAAGSTGGAGWAYYSYGAWRPQFQFAKPRVMSDASGEGPASVAQAGRARAVVDDSPVFDFGVMSRNEKRSHSFTVRNRGSLPLILTYVDKSCQCTDVRIDQKILEPRESRTIAPNESVAVTMTWHPSSFNPQFMQTARFETNDPSRIELDLVVKGRVQQIVEVRPESLRFDEIAIHHEHKNTLEVFGYRDEPIGVTRVEFLDAATADHFRATVEALPAEALKSAENARSGSRVTIELTPGLPIGRFRQRIRLHLNRPELDPIDVPLEGSIAGNLMLTGHPGYDAVAGVWNLGKLGKNDPREHSLWIIVKGPQAQTANLRVVGTEPANLLDAQLAPPIPSGKIMRHRLTLTIRDEGRVVNHLGSTQGSMAKIVLESSDPSIQRVEIPVAFATETGP